MFRKVKREIVEEYFVNDSHLKKLYNMYLHQSIFDKILDILVLFAILFTLMGLILEFLINVDDNILHLIHSASIFILVIFAIELIRSYAKSKTKKEFFKYYWLDVFLVVTLSLYFVFVTYFGFARAIQEVAKLKGFLQEFKHVKIVFEFFKNLIR